MSHLSVIVDYYHRQNYDFIINGLKSNINKCRNDVRTFENEKLRLDNENKRTKFQVPYFAEQIKINNNILSQLNVSIKDNENKILKTENDKLKHLKFIDYLKGLN